MNTNFNGRAYEAQINAIYKKLKDMSISSETFNEKLHSILPTISLENPKPLSHSFEFVKSGSISDPIQFTDAIDKLILDLKLLFSETEVIDTYIDSLNKFLKNDIYDKYAIVLDRIESQIEFFQSAILNNKGFAFAIVNNFDNTTLRTTRVEKAELFKDINGNILEDLSIQSSVGLLTLPWSESLIAYNDGIAKIRLSESNVSIVNIVPESMSNPNNAFSAIGWSGDVITKELLVDGCQVVLEIDFSETHTINAIDIEPFANGQLYISQIKYQDASDNLLALPVITSLPLVLDRKRRVISKIVKTNKILLYLNQYKAEQVDLTKEDLNGITSGSFFYYPLGLVSLKFGLQKYKDSGIFVSDSIDVESLGSIKYNDSRIGLDDIFIQSYLIVENYDNDDQLLSSHKILLASDSTVNEQLKVEDSNLAQTQVPIDNISPVSIRFNGNILPTNSLSKVTGRVNLPTNLLYNTKDKIVATYKPSYFTNPVSTPTDSSNKFKFGPDGSILIDRRYLESTYKYSRIYVNIFFSSFNNLVNSTPAIDYYTLEISKFSNKQSTISGTGKTIKTESIENAL